MWLPNSVEMSWTLICLTLLSPTRMIFENSYHFPFPWHCFLIQRISMLCSIWYHLCNLKNVENTHGGMLFSVKLQPSAWNFTKSNTPPWVFLTIFKLYKWYQITQSVSSGNSVYQVLRLHLSIFFHWRFLACISLMLTFDFV